ncbi:MAG: acyltransferase [Candidatus Shapirobacteria bacterium]|nr:acyltransferase [Candidatus Shapirobacteria bacterium]
MEGNIFIGKNTYFNSGQIITGKNSKIIIGNWCAIGYDVKILSITHDVHNPTGKNKKILESDITIGNNVWIGSNVFIKEGIKIGNNAIIGANTVVTKNVSTNTIVGGVPAKLIRKI